MKKMLSILAAVGLTATASTSVVACTTTVKASKGTWTSATKLEFKDVKVKALDKIAKDTAKDATVEGYALFDKDGKAVDGATVVVTLSDKADKDIKKGKTFKANIEVTFGASQDKADKTTYYINDKTITDKKKAKKGQATKVEAPKYKAPAKA